MAKVPDVLQCQHLAFAAAEIAEDPVIGGHPRGGDCIDELCRLLFAGFDLLHCPARPVNVREVRGSALAACRRCAYVMPAIFGAFGRVALSRRGISVLASSCVMVAGNLEASILAGSGRDLSGA
jgi:hypothetical protein